MVNGRREPELGRVQWVFGGEEELKVELAAFIGRGGGAFDYHVKMAQVVQSWCCSDARYRLFY